MHDIGHAPFSHALEYIMHKNSGDYIDNYIAKFLGIDVDELQDKAPHEKMGAYVICYCFKRVLRK